MRRDCLMRRMIPCSLRHPKSERKVLARQTPGTLVVIATNLADGVGLSPGSLTDPKRCVVVEQESDNAPVQFGAHTHEHHRTAEP